MPRITGRGKPAAKAIGLPFNEVFVAGRLARDPELLRLYNAVLTPKELQQDQTLCR